MHQHWILQHPCPAPDPGRLHRPIGLLIEPPGRLSSTRSWRQFRDEMVLLLRARPSDPTVPLYLDAADTIIAWRDTVPPEGRFWAEDRD